MKNRGILYSILVVCNLCTVASGAFAADTELARQLTSQYGEKVVALRHPYQSQSHEYTADGVPIKPGEEGPWTVYGRMLVTSVSIDADRLMVEGKRALYFFDKTGKLTELRGDRKHPAENLRIIVRLQKPISSAEEAATILAKIFAVTPGDVVNSAPPYWQPYLAKQLGIQETNGQGSHDGDREREKEDFGSGEVIHGVDFFRNKHFSPPHVLYQAEPAFTDTARAHRVEGVVGMNVVVDSTGKITNIRIVHPLGMGLDESAVSTVSQWRFTPAKHDGQPVAVAIYIEVDFHLW